MLAGRQSARHELADAAPPCSRTLLIRTIVVDFCGIGCQPQASAALSVRERVRAEYLQPKKGIRSARCASVLVVAAAESFNANAPRVFVAVGSMRLSQPKATAVTGRACNAHSHDEPRGEQLLVIGLPQELVLFNVDQIFFHKSFVQ